MPTLYDRPEISNTYFFPQPDSPLPRSERAGPVELQLADGTHIGAYWHRSLDGAPTMLYLHGNGECIADQLGHWPAWAAGAGANIFFVDYPGYASSRGTPTLSSCCEAATAALTWLLARPVVEVPRIVIAGRSVGSIFALHTAANASALASSGRVAGLMLESGIADIKARLAMRVDYDSVGIDRAAIEAELDRDFNHRAKMSRVSGPVLVLHTRNDSLVPAHNSEQLAEWASDALLALVLFARGDHNSIQLYNETAYREQLAGLIVSSGALKT